MDDYEAAMMAAEVTGRVLIRVKSNRARDKAEYAIDSLPRGRVSFSYEGEFYYVTPDQWEKLRSIKGITRARVDESKLIRCIDWT